jgi:hypothetical protein
VSAARVLAVIFVYGCTAVAWVALGGSLVQRSGQTDQRLAREVAQLWGGRHEQRPPEIWVERHEPVVESVQEKDDAGRTTSRKVTRDVTRRERLSLDSSRVNVAFHLDPRRRGLLWYATWAGTFSARYAFHNPDAVPRAVCVFFPFPSAEALYDGFVLGVNGVEPAPAGDLSKGASARLVLDRGARADVEVAYRTRGLGPWTYAFAGEGTSRVRDFRLEMMTDFDDLDFPPGTLSPTLLAAEGPGRRLAWSFESLVTAQKIGVDPPSRLNPGPFAARVTFFAPVALLFFMAVMVLLGLVRGPQLHPMHWFFVSAAFFSFHLLLAYLVDHVDVHVAFWVAAGTSVLLVVSYLRLVAGLRFALVRAGTAQLAFLVLLGYSFFLEGYTGLTVTVGAVLTLFLLMQATGRVDWTAVFARGSGSPPPGAGRVS